ncbi:MAG TPA: ABC transporter permease [Anaerolineales bacterium]|nr:ABC transporter permease [Anaerolineales bacterium]
MSARRFHITRMHIFALLFLVVGFWMVVRVPSSFEPDVVSKMSFGKGADAPVWEAPTRIVLLVIAVLYLIGGAMGLINRWPRLSFVVLMLDGILLFPAILIAAAVGKQTNMLTMLAESLRLATPIVIGATAGIWSERSGVVNIAIEGMMLTGACFGFVTFFFLEPAMPEAPNTALLIAVLVAVLSGALMSLLHAWLSITFKTDQIVSGTVINILAIGLTSFVRREFLLSTRAGRVTLPSIAIPGLVKIPIVGDVLFNNKPIFYMMFILLIVTHIVLFYTSLGLRMRSVGEHPEAADTVGINVFFTRYRNVIISGMIAGLGGAWFSLETVGGFDDVMTGGRGFIALAAMIFGKWTPAGAFGGGLLFGFADALGTRFQILDLPVPPQWLQMLPFITTMVVLAGLIGRAIPPAAVGKPYEKQ